MVQAERGGPLWTPTAYWRTYCARILRELQRDGLTALRTNQRLLKGFALGGVPQPELPAISWKRAAWTTIENLPGVRQIIGEYRRVLGAEYRRRRDVSRQHARLAMDEIARAFPDVRPPPGLANGGADDAFIWRGHTIVPAFVMYLSRAADFYSRVSPQKVTSILEIGPGLGLSSLAHIALNPNIRFIANVDIPPILYLSTQFLKSIDGIAVEDARTVENAGPIIPQGVEGRVRVYQLAPWQLPRLEGPIDFFFNAFSFQEMERDVCRNYAAHVLRLVQGGVFLHSMTTGHKPGAGGQNVPVTLDFLESLFKEKFPHVSQLDGFWPRLFDEDVNSTRLMISGAD